MFAESCPMLKRRSAQLVVADLQRSVEFYINPGFEICFFYADFYCRITRGGHTIHLK